MADADARMKALEKELLKELEKVRSLKDETLKALALDFTKMGEVQRILDSIKKATAVLGFKEDKPEKKTTSNAQRMCVCVVMSKSPKVGVAWAICSCCLKMPTSQVYLPRVRKHSVSSWQSQKFFCRPPLTYPPPGKNQVPQEQLHRAPSNL